MHSVSETDRSIPAREWALVVVGRLVLAAWLAVWLLVCPEIVMAQDWLSAEYKSKATFLANVPSFVDWPADAFPAAHSPFYLCVFGNFPFGTSLTESARNTLAHGRRIEVKWARKEADLKGCHMLFLHRSEAKRYAWILELVRGANVLTVGETPDFLELGGTVAFSMQQQTVRFEVNLNAADSAKLKFNSRLLSLAKRVVNRTDPARS